MQLQLLQSKALATNELVSYKVKEEEEEEEKK